MCEGGFIVPADIAKDVFGEGVVVSGSVFVPLKGEKGRKVNLDFGAILTIEQYNQKVKECLAYYAKAELLRQRVRELEAIWDGGEYMLRLSFAADEWLTMARDLRHELEMTKTRTE